MLVPEAFIAPADAAVRPRHEPGRGQRRQPRIAPLAALDHEQPAVETSVHILRSAFVRCAGRVPSSRGTPVALTPSMPSATDILAQLATAANEVMPLAIAWHVLIALVAVAMLRGWRPPGRHAAWLLIGPALSVGFVWSTTRTACAERGDAARPSTTAALGGE